LLIGCPAEPLDENANGDAPPAGQQPGQNSGQMQPNNGQMANENIPGTTATGSNDPNITPKPPEQGGQGGPTIDPDNPPSFADLIENDEAITLTISITNAEAFTVEFLYVKEEGDTKQPTLIHRESTNASPLTIKAPKNYANQVWLEIREGAGGPPNENSLSAGSKDALTFGEEDMALEFELVKGEEYKENWDWFSKEPPPENSDNQ
jgi:hypothetical protein